MLLRFLRWSGAEDERGRLAGEIGREGCGVGCVDDRWRCFFFLRTEASVPEASERLGLPGRFSEFEEPDFFITRSRSLSIPPCFSFLPEGVLAPDDRPDFLSASAFSRLRFFSSSTLRRSSSESV